MIIRFVKSFIAKPVVFFTASRYLSYALLFLRGMLIAKILGPYFFGIWGFITLYQQYLSFTSMGIQYAINTELALLDAVEHARRKSLINTSFTLTLLIFAAVTLSALVLQYFQIEVFKTEGSYKFIFLTFLIGGLQHFRELFANIYRIFNDYWRIAAGELLIAIVTLVVIFFYSNESLIFALLTSWATSLAVSIAVFLVKSPIQLRLAINHVDARILLSIGFPLLLYSISYYLMTLSSRTIISIYYDLEIIGYYTFAYTITNATLLGLNAASWVFYPTLLAKLKEGTPEPELKETIARVSSLYNVAVVLLVYLCIIASPVFYLFLEKYEPAATVLNILLLAQAVLSIGFVFNTLLIARKKHNQLAIVSLICTLLSAALGFIFAVLHWNFLWLAIATLISFILFTITLSLLAFKILKIKEFSLLKFFPPNLVVSMVIFLLGTFSSYALLFYTAGLVTFVVANWKNIQDIIKFIFKVKA